MAYTTEPTNAAKFIIRSDGLIIYYRDSEKRRLIKFMYYSLDRIEGNFAVLVDDINAETTLT